MNSEAINGSNLNEQQKRTAPQSAKTTATRATTTTTIPVPVPATTEAFAVDANESDFVLVNAKVANKEEPPPTAAAAKRLESAKVAPFVSVPVTTSAQPSNSNNKSKNTAAAAAAVDANLLEEFIRNKTFHGSCEKQASFLVNEIDEQIATKQSLRKLNTLRYGSLIVLLGLAALFFIASINGETGNSGSDRRTAFHCRMGLLTVLLLILMSQFMIYVYERHSYRKNAVIILSPAN